MTLLILAPSVLSWISLIGLDELILFNNNPLKTQTLGEKRE